ncbi:GntR family transcriptional regulator [Georgenia thermotolerans]|uniref:GntR family transcriptional regulator n=1 Tax=Georgenia thermotolerans TaxID=527326 RepID=UPI0029C9F6B3|nr:GntR family transcriptional regulator [Georgenia thermotolerans]
MILVVDATSHVPPYEQVRSQVAAAIEDGTLAAGHRLQPMRRMAEELGLAVNTVARAYRELEQAGLIVSRGRRGTFVTARGTDREREARAAARQYVRRMAELGLTLDQAVEEVRRLGASRAT